MSEYNISNKHTSHELFSDITIDPGGCFYKISAEVTPYNMCNRTQYSVMYTYDILYNT